jgi:hypothetical protein
MEARGVDALFIGEQVMPVITVPTKAGIYPKVVTGSGRLLTGNGDVRMPDGSYPRQTRGWTSDTYDCLDRGLEEAVDDTVAKDVGRFFDVEVATAGWLLRSMKISYEQRVAAAIMSTGTFGGGTAPVVSYIAANIATINFPADIIAAIQRVQSKGEMPDTIILSSNVADRIAQSTIFQNWLRGNRPADSTLGVNANMLQQIFAYKGIKNVFIGQSVVNTAKEGQTAVISKIWGDTYIWVGSVQGGTIEGGGSGRTFVWNEEGGMWVTETYRDEKVRSNILRVRQNETEKVTNANAGTLITTTYS